MDKKSIFLATSAFVFSVNVNAAIVDHGMYTTDTDSGLDWLDLTETTSRTYNDINSQLGAGGEFEGWHYATEAEIVSFLDAFGGDSDYYYSGSSTQNNGLFDMIAPLWGDTYCAYFGCAPGQGQSEFIYHGINDSETHITAGWIRDNYDIQHYEEYDEVQIAGGLYSIYVSSSTGGHALVRDMTVVPLPGAVWLFSSGLVGLVGFARRKKA